VWGDVIDAIEMGQLERERTRTAMAHFGRQIEQLSEAMRACGVDDEIVSYLQPSIETQIRQLLDLAPPGDRVGSPVQRMSP
jgi:serine/threonine-protein kinase HipA